MDRSVGRTHRSRRGERPPQPRKPYWTPPHLKEQAAGRVPAAGDHSVPKWVPWFNGPDVRCRPDQLVRQPPAPPECFVGALICTNPHPENRRIPCEHAASPLEHERGGDPGLARSQTAGAVPCRFPRIHPCCPGRPRATVGREEGGGPCAGHQAAVGRQVNEISASRRC